VSLKALLGRLDDKTHFSATPPAAPAPFAPKGLAAESLEQLERERPGRPTKANGVIGAVGAIGAARRSSDIDLAAFHERAAIMEYDGGMPRGEADQAAAREMCFATPEALYRAAIEAWRLEIAAAPQTGIPGFDKLAAVSLRFLGGDWAPKALAADWDETALFAVHEGKAPQERHDAWGLIPVLAWGIHRCTIETFGRDACLLRTQHDATLRQPRTRANFDEALPWWRHPGIVKCKPGAFPCIGASTARSGARSASSA
jgi:hypothetical protein